MIKYDYLEALKEDILNYIKENDITINEDSFDELIDQLYMSDSVTGNSSGSYTMSTWKAEEYIAHNWDLLRDACNEFSIILDLEKHNAEYYDVLIRCYLVGEVLFEVIKDHM